MESIAVLFVVAGVLVLLVAAAGRPQVVTIRVEHPPRDRVRLITDLHPGEDVEELLARHYDRAHRLGLDDPARWTPGSLRFGRRPGPPWLG